MDEVVVLIREEGRAGAGYKRRAVWFGSSGNGRVHGWTFYHCPVSVSSLHISPLSLFIWKKLLFIHSWRIRTRDARRAVWSLFGKWCYSDRDSETERAGGKEARWMMVMMMTDNRKKSSDGGGADT